jgi:hypothetical protein
MNVLLIGIILTMLDIAIARYQISRNPNASVEALDGEDRWTVRPM